MTNPRNDAELTTSLLSLTTRHASASEYLGEALPAIRSSLSAKRVLVAAADRGVWSLVASDGGTSPPPAKLPTELLADVLDSHAPQSAGSRQAAPLPSTTSSGSPSPQEVLAIEGAAGDGSLVALTNVATTLGSALASVRRQEANHRRLQRLEAIVDITAAWNQTREMEPLLIHMAEVATTLLHADRASIFLWDKPNKILVGRPALGVEGGELRIGDDVGVVGEVVQTGEPRRADTVHDADTIDRQVDEQLQYQTDSLLCVPLRDTDGEMLGAFEVINKLEGNFTAGDQEALIELAAHAATALSNTQELEQLVSRHQVIVDQAADEVTMIGQSPAIEAIRSTIARIADTDLAVLILGENGTGKEIAARMIHYQSRRRAEPLVALNCAAIPDTLLESELFGHEKGAFTDAQETRVGKFELAATGTLFLDEIGDMSQGGQSKLLRVLEDKTVVRVGGSTPIHTDARVIAATNQGLATMVEDKSFRQDLYFRLNVVTIELPPLRDRGEDIVLLAEHFLSDFAAKAGRRRPTFTAAAKKALLSHSWPGNIRELRNTMERLAYLTTGTRIDGDEVQQNLLGGNTRASQVPDDLPLTEATTCFQQDYIRRAVERSQGNMSAAAERLGLHRSNLYRKMRQLDMPTRDDEE